MDSIFFDTKNHEFATRNILFDSAELKVPISVIAQVTRRCNLDCKFCSESEQFPDPSLTDLEQLRDKLDGVKRVYLSGGEPLLREDIFDVIKLYKGSFDVLGLPTNCTLLSEEICQKLRGSISYINAGLDGPRAINDSVRGDYDGIIRGLINLRRAGLEVSLSSVILKSTLPGLRYVVNIADSLGVTKVKMVVPILRGRACGLKSSDFASRDEILAEFEEIKRLKRDLGWRPRVKFTFWDERTEGYALIIYPNQKVYAWPVLDAPNSVMYIGDLRQESMQEIWRRYPYKENHINKYVGLSMYKV